MNRKKAATLAKVPPSKVVKKVRNEGANRLELFSTCGELMRIAGVLRSAAGAIDGLATMYIQHNEFPERLGFQKVIKPAVLNAHIELCRLMGLLPERRRAEVSQ